MTTELNHILNRDMLSADGFRGWVRVDDFSVAMVPPRQPGVYLVYRPQSEPPTFLPVSSAGPHKRQDPTEDPAILEAKWVPGTHVLYVGKADPSPTNDLRKRIRAFIRQGQGQSAGHWGGRYVWQLRGTGELLLAWKVTDKPRLEERTLLGHFESTFGALPFANLRR